MKAYKKGKLSKKEFTLQKEVGANLGKAIYKTIKKRIKTKRFN